MIQDFVDLGWLSTLVFCTLNKFQDFLAVAMSVFHPVLPIALFHFCTPAVWHDKDEHVDSSRVLACLFWLLFLWHRQQVTTRLEPEMSKNLRTIEIINYKFPALVELSI